MIQSHHPRRSGSTLRGVVLTAALAAPALSACAPDRVTQQPPIASDYRARHPIALAHAAASVDIIPAGGRLDARSREQVRAFAADYRASGGGPVAIQAPAGGANAQIIDSIRRDLAAAGVTGGVSLSTYQPADPTLVSPIRLSYQGTKAIVRSRCGEWPRDLASGSTIEGWQNQPYWNHGCAYQQALASQVADPRDLATPRAEVPSDVAMRTRAISKVREGSDPGTEWKIENTSIGTAGAN